MGSDNKVIEGTEREKEGWFADICIFMQVVWEMKRKNWKHWYRTKIIG